MNKNLLEEILKKLKKKGCDEADIVFAEGFNNFFIIKIR